MKRYSTLLAITVSILSLVNTSAYPLTHTTLLVRLQPAIATTEQHRLFRSVEATAIDEIPQLNLWCVSVPTARAGNALATLNREPAVVYAEPDGIARATFLPGDPGWGQQWGPQTINAPQAWDTTVGSSDVVIAVLDSGITLGHPDLTARLWSNPGEIPDNRLDDDNNGKVDDFWGWRFYHKWDGLAFVPREDNHVTDDYGHGTHVAGIAGAEIDNSEGIAGVAGGSRLMIVKVLDQYGYAWYSDLAQGIVYAVDNGARIINLSLGGDTPSQTLQDAVDYAYAHGVLVVAAAGNDGGAVLYPGACEHVLTVAATDQDDGRVGFSNHGPQVDVAAPGVDIYSTWPWVGGYFTKSGTSMAAPHVVGLAALIWSARSNLAMERVTGIITATATDVNDHTSPGWDEYVGWGRIDAGRALTATVHAGKLHLAASHPQLPVGATTTITATASITPSTTLTFTASGGAVSPEVTTLGDGMATTTFNTGPFAGMAVVTATTQTLTGTLYVRLRPGPPISTTLIPASWEVTPGRTVPLTLTATDSLGNPPLDGTPINWAASRGTVTPIRSTSYAGLGRALFTAGPLHGPAVITASFGAAWVTTITIDVSPSHSYYLPSILHRGDHYH